MLEIGENVVVIATGEKGIIHDIRTNPETTIYIVKIENELRKYLREHLSADKPTEEPTSDSITITRQELRDVIGEAVNSILKDYNDSRIHTILALQGVLISERAVKKLFDD